MDSRQAVHERIVVLMTCHNRREKTLACLEHLFAQRLGSEVSLDAILVDDGSTDGTAKSVQDAYPEVRIEEGDGTLFWNGGMRLAMDKAFERDYDYYVWLNDDALLHPQALSTLLEAEARTRERTQRSVIVVGSTQDPVNGRLTYGGVSRSSRWHPLKFRRVEPGGECLPCEAMNGNCVLIPREVAMVVGNLDVRFTHLIGDYDYALRAREAGFGVYVAPGYAGTCRRNTADKSWEDARLTLLERWNRVNGPKGLPFREWMVFSRRYAGPLWFLYGSLPYIRLITSSLTRIGVRADSARCRNGL